MTRPESPQGGSKPCACVKDGLAALPPELRPRPQRKSSLRPATCPGCGLAYWTNRASDVCIECEIKSAPTPAGDDNA